MAKAPVLATVGDSDPETFWEKVKPKLPTANWELVTPQQAHQYLERNNNNRKKRSGTVSFYATAMEKDQWYLTHQAIALDENGNIIDGQHRLLAILAYGKPVLCLVVRGVPAETKQVCDQMLKRQGDDALRWAGEEYHGSAPSSIIRRMAMGIAWDYKISNPDLIAISKKYHRHVQFAMDCFPSNKAHVTQTAVKAVLARAHCNRIEEEALREFANILYNGTSDSAPVIRFRDFLMKNPGVRASISIREVYAKCEKALHMFVEGLTLTGKSKLTGTTTELYPISWDKEMEEVEAEKAKEEFATDATDGEGEVEPAAEAKPAAARARGKRRKRAG